MQTPATVGNLNMFGDEETSGDGEQYIDVGGLFALANSDSAVVSHTGVTANSVCSSWQELANRILQTKGSLRVSTYPGYARFRFGHGRLRGVRRAADVPVDVTGKKRRFAAFASEADILALLREGALEALDDQLRLPRGKLHARKGAIYS